MTPGTRTAARRRTVRWLLAVLLVIASLPAGGCASPVGNADLPETRVLFIGNSYTAFNGGIDQVLRGLAPRTTVDIAAPGGFTLTQHLRDAATLAKLRSRPWTYVVIQEQSQLPVIDARAYVAGLRGLVAEARAVGAVPVLLMTWARPDDPRIGTSAMLKAVTAAGRGVKAAVIPAGVAFDAVQAAHPDIVLTLDDGHPTPLGTYLAGCVVYARLFGVSPEGNTFTGGLDRGAVATLQAAAERAARTG